jgi:hypothetical protein|tara:strand:+ start:936 stop:1193 length:258 start_codon:yes stop_codon:yes gene_type:complete
MAFKMKGCSPFKQSNTTNSKVITKDTELSIAAKKTAADIAKNGNNGKKISDYTPEQLKLIRNKKYQEKLSKELEKQMKENPDKGE